jgi:hypothetical protein
VNHHAASSAFREPPPRGKADLSSRIRFRAIVFAVNSGYRTRYPHVAVVTNRSAGREEGPALKGRHRYDIQGMLALGDVAVPAGGT